jgi:hypothetical protein
MVSMTEREELIEEQVTTMHLNVPERAALSTHSVRYSEVAAVVSSILEESGISHRMRGSGKKEM